MKYIRRVSKVKNDDTKGYIINSTNVVDKEKNTYSANVIDGLLTGWENVNFASTTDIIDKNRSRILVNKALKLVRVNLVVSGTIEKGTTKVATIPKEYRPNLMPNDSCWFIMWRTNGDIVGSNSFARGLISSGSNTADADVSVLQGQSSLSSVAGYVIYPYA